MGKILRCIPDPKRGSHKGQNGVALIIGGSRTYHGAPILAARAAMRFCDLVYFSSTPENAEVMKKMRIATANVICVPKKRLSSALAHADCVLVGNGMDVDRATRTTVGRMLKSGKRCVLDAAALRVLPRKLLHRNVIVTPHEKEFVSAFGIGATRENAKRMAKEWGCTILLKGKEDFVASPEKCAVIDGGNAGMTKGGTGDVLAGLCCALFARSASPFDAACASSALNKAAGEILYRIYGPNFSSEELADELPFAAVRLR